MLAWILRTALFAAELLTSTMTTTMKALRKIQPARGLSFETGEGAGDWTDRCAGARANGVDLRDGFAHLWVGPMVAGADQAAGDLGA